MRIETGVVRMQETPRAPALALYVNSVLGGLQAQGGAALLKGEAPVFKAG